MLAREGLEGRRAPSQRPDHRLRDRPPRRRFRRIHVDVGEALVPFGSSTCRVTVPAGSRTTTRRAHRVDDVDVVRRVELEGDRHRHECRGSALELDLPEHGALGVDPVDLVVLRVEDEEVALRVELDAARVGEPRRLHLRPARRAMPAAYRKATSRPLPVSATTKLPGVVAGDALRAP